MSEQMSPGEAAQALDEIQRRQQQVIDLAAIPPWYWWAIGGLMVVLGVGVDIRTPAAIGITVPVFVVGLLAANGWVIGRAYRHAQLRNGLIDGRGVLAILGFVAVIAGGTIGLAFALRGAGAHYPATWACLAGGLVMGLGGPVLNRWLRRVMLGNRARRGPMSAARFDELIHAPTRLSIVSLLAASEWADFNFIRDTVGLSDSALSKQLTTLEEAGISRPARGSSASGREPRPG